MNQKELNSILEKHKLWLENNPKGQKADLQRADLQYADLRGADLQRADLRWADLQEADLQEADLQRADLQRADLRGADLDFSAFPLWCGSFNIIDDGRLTKQLLGHLARLDKTHMPKDLQNFLSKIPKKYSNHLCNRHIINKV